MRPRTAMTPRRSALLVACCAVALFACVGAKPRTGRDWAKLTEKDWQRIEEEWETPEEKEEYEYKPPKQKGLDMEKLQKEMKKTKKGKPNPKVQQMIAESQQSTGPAMMFATLDYPDCCEKNKTEEISTKWASMLRTSGMDISTCARRFERASAATPPHSPASCSVLRPLALLPPGLTDARPAHVVARRVRAQIRDRGRPGSIHLAGRHARRRDT